GRGRRSRSDARLACPSASRRLLIVPLLRPGLRQQVSATENDHRERESSQSIHRPFLSNVEVVGAGVSIAALGARNPNDSSIDERFDCSSETSACHSALSTPPAAQSEFESFATCDSIESRSLVIAVASRSKVSDGIVGVGGTWSTSAIVSC